MSTISLLLTYHRHYLFLPTPPFMPRTSLLLFFKLNNGLWMVLKHSLSTFNRCITITLTNIDFDILGVLAVLLKNNVGLDNQILKDAETDFGKDMLFNQIIRHMERLKRYDRTGIAEKGLTKYDMHDTRCIISTTR